MQSLDTQPANGTCSLPATDHFSNFCPLVAISIVALYQQSILLHLHKGTLLPVVHVAQ